MINFDGVTKQNIKEHNPSSTNSLSSIQNINNWRIWIWKNKLIT